MDVDAAVQSQIRNIEATYDKPLDHWFAVIDASGLAKHNQVVAMLKADHRLAHGAARRVSLLSRQRHDAGVTQAPDPAAALYAGAKAMLGPAQHYQPHRPRADPAGHNASDRTAGTGGQVQLAVHSPRPHHRSHRP